MSTNASGSVAKRMRFAAQHMMTAAQLARLATEIEADYDDSQYSDDLFFKHRGYVTSAIVMSAASVEANINEFLDNLKDGYGNIKHKLAEHIQEQQKYHWSILDEKRINTLDKYQLALWWADVKLDKGNSPYQDVEHLFNFRNGMMHFRPSFIQIDPSPNDPFDFKPRGLAKAAKYVWANRKIKNHPNPILSSETRYSIFPDKCLSYACAKWAVEAGINFINHFYEQLGLESSLEDFEEHLKLPDIP